MPVEPAPAALATPVAGPGGDEKIELAKQAAGEFARKLGTRRVESGAPVRNLFATSLAGELPPLASLLRGGGRGGQTRIKLYLSLLWVSAAKPYETVYPSRAWAALLGLDDPDAKGARRIQESVRELADRHLIVARDRGGLPSALQLLDESGSTDPYQAPSEAYNAYNQAHAPREVLQRHAYFKIPSKLWTEGHIARLSGPGIAMLTVLLCERRGKTDGEVWFTPDIAKERFRLAPVTRTAGLQELRDLGLMKTRKAEISHDGTYISFRRRRNVHTLLLK
jgi:hypothetical protein